MNSAILERYVFLEYSGDSFPTSKQGELFSAKFLRMISLAGIKALFTFISVFEVLRQHR